MLQEDAACCHVNILYCNMKFCLKINMPTIYITKLPFRQIYRIQCRNDEISDPFVKPFTSSQKTMKHSVLTVVEQIRLAK